MGSETEAAITIRRLRLPFPDEIDPMVVAGQPEESFFNIGMSLLLPYLEPYLIRSMNQAKPHVTDPKLLSDIALFNGQEGQHYRQHIRFNEALRLGTFAKLKALEAELAEDYRRFTAERSLRFNLAYAEGFEAYTMATARFAFESKAFERMTPAVGDLFEWHLLEEIEHRTVAFDVYAHVCGGYFYRLFVGFYAQWHLARFAMRVTAAMKEADPKAFKEKWGGVFAAWRRTGPLLWLALRLLLPKVLATYLPWYSPHRIEMPPEALARARHYTELAAADATTRPASDAT